MPASSTVLETERLVLRRFDLADAEFIVELLNDAAFLEHIGDKGVRSLEEAREYLQSGPLDSYQRYGYGLFMVMRRQDRAPVGMCGLLKRDELPDPDIGFAFLPQFRSIGYALESAAAVLDYGRDELSMHRIVAITNPGNDSSIRLLTRLGLTFEGSVCLSEDGDALNLYVTAKS